MQLILIFKVSCIFYNHNYYIGDDSENDSGRELTEKEADDIREEFEARYKKRKIQVHLFKEK